MVQKNIRTFERLYKGIKMTKYQENLKIVLPRIMKLVEEDEYLAEYFAEDLEEILNDIHYEDGFGTEGENDPRGDFRKGEWTLLEKGGVQEDV